MPTVDHGTQEGPAAMKTAAKICLVLGLLTLYMAFNPRDKPRPPLSSPEFHASMLPPVVLLTASTILFAKTKRRAVQQRESHQPGQDPK